MGAGTLPVRVLDGARRGAARGLLVRVPGVPVSEDGDPAALPARVPRDAPATRARR